MKGLRSRQARPVHAIHLWDLRRRNVDFASVQRRIHGLDPTHWVDLGDGRFVHRSDVQLHLDLDEVVDGEEWGEIPGGLPDKVEVFVLGYGAVDLAVYPYAVMDRREADGEIVPCVEPGDAVGLGQFNVGCLLYGREAVDTGIRRAGLKVALQPAGLS